MADEKPRVVKGAAVQAVAIEGVDNDAFVVDMVWSDGDVTSYAYTKLVFRESAFIGKTDPEIEALLTRDETTA